MTAQISDQIFYHDESYVVGGINGEGLFHPLQYGFTPTAISSACWRGFYCVYEVADKLLCLKTLTIRLDQKIMKTAEEDQGPKLFGVLPTYLEDKSCLVYNDIGQRMQFTGGLLLGADFIGTRTKRTLSI